MAQAELADFRKELELHDFLLVTRCSTAAIIAGPSIKPAAAMDDPSTAPELMDYTGLNLTELAVVPHGQGTTGS